jgi:hypothetical protein
MTPDEEVHCSIGSLLVLLQSAEKAMNFVMTWVLRDTTVRTIDDIMRLEKANQKKTLGQFFFKLRQSFHVNAKFDALLTDFLEDRNLFIHSLVAEFDFETETGRNAVHEFIRKLSSETMLVLKVFSAFTQRWITTVGGEATIRSDATKFYDSEFYKSLEADILPYIDAFIQPKEP